MVAAIAIIILAAMHSRRHDNTVAPASPSTAQQTANHKSKSACQIFTLADAKKVLGPGAKGGPPVSSNSSKDLAVSACTYTSGASGNAPMAGIKNASLLVQTPKNDQGIKANQKQFGTDKPADAVDVSGYGQQAYWDPQYGQLNILKNNKWYIVSNGPVTPADRTLDQAKNMADLLINKL